MSLTPPQLFATLVVVAVLMLVTGIRGGWIKLPKRRVKYDDLDAQIAADFAPGERAEARALVDSVLAHARPDDQKRAWRSLLDGTRGNLPRLRKVAPKVIESLARVYRMFGDTLDDAPKAE
jgi:hypothetical protein